MIEAAPLMTRPIPPGDESKVPPWVKRTIQTGLLLGGILGSYFGGGVQGKESAFSAARALAESAVSARLEEGTFRALEAEAARDDRVPSSVVSHLAEVIATRDAELRACRMGE